MKRIAVVLLAGIVIGCSRDIGPGANPPPSLKAKTTYLGFSGIVCTIEHDGHKWVIAYMDATGKAISMIHRPDCPCKKHKVFLDNAY